MRVDRLAENQELRIRCVNTGTYFKLALAEAQHGTFVDGEAGMEPATLQTRVFDVVAGKRYFRSWDAPDARRARPGRLPRPRQRKGRLTSGPDGRSWTRTRDLFLIREAL
jgi:hypothetical protein